MSLAEVHCAGCGLTLWGESHAGPPRREFTPADAELLTWRLGWRDGRCPACRPIAGAMELRATP